MTAETLHRSQLEDTADDDDEDEDGEDDDEDLQNDVDNIFIFAYYICIVYDISVVYYITIT